MAYISPSLRVLAMLARTMDVAPALFLAAISLAPLLARAAACWFEHGVVVVPARVAGVAGDYILDTGAPATLLHETRAQMEGHAETNLRGEVRVAGLALTDQTVAVADLDARTYGFETPIAGVIGADVLAGQIVDIDFAPCRVTIWEPGKAPRFQADQILAMPMVNGQPTVMAAVADGPRPAVGQFGLSTGLDAAIRLDEGQARVPGARLEDLAPYGARRAQLRALSFAGTLFETLPAGLEPSAEGRLGTLGAQVLSHWHVRFDFSRGHLLLGPSAQTKKAPAVTGAFNRLRHASQWATLRQIRR